MTQEYQEALTGACNEARKLMAILIPSVAITKAAKDFGVDAKDISVTFSKHRKSKHSKKLTRRAWYEEN